MVMSPLLCFLTPTHKPQLMPLAQMEMSTGCYYNILFNRIILRGNGAGGLQRRNREGGQYLNCNINQITNKKIISLEGREKVQRMHLMICLPICLFA